MIIADLNKIEGRTYPARRRTQNIVGGVSPIQAKNFAIGMVTLEPDGGQVPWHNQEQEEVYFIIEGTGEMCLGTERQILKTGQAAYIPNGI
ncbi:MAG: cupin domain-containing protein, partial [Kiritimatiellae bacterium]|nr:cupin domain-containing protein [Kiritimatiellia bacterium]